MDKEKFLQSGLLEQHILGITSPDEDEIVKAHLQRYPELQDVVAEYRREMDAYSSSQLSDVQPIEAHAAVGGASQPTATASIPWLQIRWSAVFALLFGILGVVLYRQNVQLRHQLQHEEAAHAALKTYCEEERERQRALHPWIALLQSSHTKALLLTAGTPAKEHLGVAYWNTKLKQACLAPVWLPTAPSGHQYQVWADVDGEMISIGLVPCSHKNIDMLPVAFLHDAESINITLELAGGATHPNLSAVVSSVAI